MAPRPAQSAQSPEQSIPRPYGLTVGTKIRIERDETRHPSRGTWPHFRGRTGTIIEVNRAGGGATEYGISFTKSKRTDAWFQSHEITRTRGDQ